MTAPDPKSGWSRETVVIKNALICPPLAEATPGHCAVFDGDQVSQHATTWRFGNCQTKAPSKRPTPTKHLSGRHMWGGMYFAHFGHFVSETISRLWALPDADVDSVLFAPKHQAHLGIRGRQEELTNLLGLTQDVDYIREVTEVEELVVPGQGIGLGNMAGGTPEFRAMLAQMRAHVKPKGPKNIYISRTRFGGRGGVLNEKHIEQNFREAGYGIVHPERLSVTEQFAHYCAAEKIVSTDNSALHLVGFMATPQQDVAIILRRTAKDYESIARQLTSMMGHAPVIIGALSANWMPERQHRPNHTSWGQLDYDYLEEQLKAAGFVSPACPWQQPLPQEVQASADSVSDRYGEEHFPRPVLDKHFVTGGRDTAVSPPPYERSNAQQERSDTKAGDKSEDAPSAPVSRHITAKPRVEIVGTCRFSMLGRGDWKAYKNQPDEKLEEIYQTQAKELFAPERIEDRLKTFNELTLRAFKAQSDPDFRFIVVTSDRLPKRYLKELKDMCSEVEQVYLKVVPPCHISEVQKTAISELDLSMPDCAQFRLDDDDSVSIDFVRRARMHATAMWSNSNFSMSFAQQYYCVSDGPTEGVYNWYSPFFSAGAFVRHKNKSVFDFGHYAIPRRLLAVVDAHFPNIVTHRGANDTPRHDERTLRKRGMVRATRKEVENICDRHFTYLTDTGMKLCGFHSVLAS